MRKSAHVAACYLVIVMIALLVGGCGASTGSLSGTVSWKTPSETVPIGGAIVELHTFSAGSTQFIMRVTTDEEGRFTFGELVPGPYVTPLVLWEAQASSNPCPGGNPWQLIGGWMDTAAAENGVKGLTAGGMQVDFRGVEEQRLLSREKGIPWLGFAAVGGERMVEPGAVANGDIQFECR